MRSNRTIRNVTNATVSKLASGNPVNDGITNPTVIKVTTTPNPNTSLIIAANT